jgi:hypothetical protein
MSPWTLKALVDRRSPEAPKSTIVKGWFEGQYDDVQQAFLTRMKFLAGLPKDGWDRPYVGQLRHGECKGLFEIVISVVDVEHRPLGYFSGEMEFTIVAFATERDGKFDPKSVCATAKKLIQAIAKGEEHVRIFTV